MNLNGLIQVLTAKNTESLLTTGKRLEYYEIDNMAEWVSIRNEVAKECQWPKGHYFIPAHEILKVPYFTVMDIPITVKDAKDSLGEYYSDL